MSKKIYRADFLLETPLNEMVTQEVSRHNSDVWASKMEDISRRLKMGILAAPMLTKGLLVVVDKDPPQIRVLLNGDIAIQITQVEEL